MASGAHSSDVLLHSTKRGRLFRRLDGVRAHAICLSPLGVVLVWNNSQHRLSTFTLNGVPIASAQLPICNINCMEISADGQTALLGVNSSDDLSGSSNIYRDSSFKKSYGNDDDKDDELNEADQRIYVSPPAICFVDLHCLKVSFNPLPICFLFL